MSRILLLHVDGKLPNVALMRISAHHRALCDEVVFRHAPTTRAVEPEFGDQFDLIYASAIFERSRPVLQRLLEVRPDAIVGGTGWDLGRTLEDFGVVTREQDYSLYPRFRPSIGFSQRGCRLRCEFCVVPRKEGAAREEQTIGAIWRGEGHPREILLLAGVAGARRGASRRCVQGLLLPGDQRTDDLGGGGRRDRVDRLPG